MSTEPTQAGAGAALATPIDDESLKRSLLSMAQAPPSSKHVLEPIERISETLFGLIMVLTFTCSFSVAEAGRVEIRNLLLAAIGCNLAWGTIDAIMYLMGCLADKARSLATLRAVQSASDPQKAQRIVANALPPLLAAAMSPPQLEAIRRLVRELPEPASHPRLSKGDWFGAAGVFSLVVLSTCPVVLPFALMENAMRAQRLSNAIAIGLMFLTGYAFGHRTGYHPVGTGVAMVIIGGVLVGLTIALGG
jgi:hypothetical protein